MMMFIDDHLKRNKLKMIYLFCSYNFLFCWVARYPTTSIYYITANRIKNINVIIIQIQMK